MAFYSYFAYGVMLTTLFLAIKYCIEGFLLKRALNAEGNQTAADANKGVLEPLFQRFSELPRAYWKNENSSQEQPSLKEQTVAIFAPLLLKLSSIKSVAPALGLCFTVISIMASFQIFSASGDIKAMFQAASIGLGTTAIGAMTIVISKLMIDRVLLPFSSTLLARYQSEVVTIKQLIQLNKQPLKQELTSGRVKQAGRGKQ